MRLATDPRTFTPQEAEQYMVLRTLEWGNWPAFVSQILAPPFFLIAEPYFVIANVLAANLLWGFTVRNRYANWRLGHYGAVLVATLKWPVCLGCGAYLAWRHEYWAAGCATFWPLIVLLVMHFSAYPYLNLEVIREQLTVSFRRALHMD